MSEGMIGLQLGRAPEGLRRRLQLALTLEYAAEVAVGQGVIGLQLYGASMGGGGLVEASQGLQGHAEIEVGFGDAGSDVYGPSESVRHLLVTTQIEQSRTKIVEKAWFARADADRPTDQFNGDVVAAHLVRQDPEQVQGIGIGWVDGQDLPVDRLGGVQTTGLMVCKR
jgi:hypothetical protein